MANNGIYYSSGHSLNFTTTGTTWATLTSGGTFVIDTVSGGTYLNLPSTTFTGGTVTGATIFTGGLTANTLNVTGDTTLANVTGTSFYTDYIDFNLTASTPAHSEGRLHWLDDTKTLQIDTEVSDFAIELGHQNIVRVRNTTGSPLAKGRIVYITGGSGNRPLVTLANYSGDSTSARTLGFIAEEIAHNSNGYVITYGLIRGTTSTPLNTSAYSAGTQLYLYTGGTFTNTRPVAPLHEVRVGVVIASNANEGVIFVSIMNGYELEELHDVRISGKSEGDLVVYDSTLNVWENSKTLNGSYQITGTLTATTISATTYQNLPQSVSGTGTTNYVPKWTGSTGLGDSLIQDDGTQVYIGTVPTHAGTKFNSGGPLEVGEGIQILGIGGSSIGITDTDLQSWTTGGNEIAIGSGGPLSVSQSTDNIALGRSSLQNNTTGINNIGIGSFTLLGNTDGNDNIGIGVSALQTNKSGFNIGIGSSALTLNFGGVNNVAVGYQSLQNNVEGTNNVGIGAGSLISNDSGSYNIGIGSESLYSNLSGDSNVSIGHRSLQFNTTGDKNLSIGFSSLRYNTTGYSNISLGYHSLINNTIGFNNVSIGEESLTNNIVGYNNIGIGYRALSANTSGYSNIAIGQNVLTKNQDGVTNIAIGLGALSNLTGGSNQIAIGYNAGNSNNSSSGNIFIGAKAGEDNINGSFNTVIGNTAGQNGEYTGSTFIGEAAGYGSNSSNSVFIGYNAGSAESSNERLYIRNLIYGEFDNSLVKINGTLSATTYLNMPSSTFTGGTVTGPTNFTNGLSANTISATTYQNLPSFNSVKINGTTQFSGNTNNFINFSGINITITSAATNTLVFSAGTGGSGSGLTEDYYTILVNQGGTNFADSTTYYIGLGGYLASTIANTRNVYVPFTSTLTNVLITAGASNAASTENTTVYFRLNNTTDTLLSSTVKFSGGNAQANGTILSYSISGLSVSVTAGNFFEIKLVTPVWTTNPTAGGLTILLYFRR